MPDPQTFEKLTATFDLIVNTVSASLDWNQYLSLLKVDGTPVVVGIPDKPFPINAFGLVTGRRSLAGSMIGGIKETQEMLDFCGEHGITSDIEAVDMQDVNEAYERALESDVRYRFVIGMKSLQTNETTTVRYCTRCLAKAQKSGIRLYLKPGRSNVNAPFS